MVEYFPRLSDQVQTFLRIQGKNDSLILTKSDVSRVVLLLVLVRLEILLNAQKLFSHDILEPEEELHAS